MRRAPLHSMRRPTGCRRTDSYGSMSRTTRSQPTPEALREAIEKLTSVRIFDVHLQDALNLQHPSYFDSTSQYNMLVFRKLSSDMTPLAETPGIRASCVAGDHHPADHFF